MCIHTIDLASAHYLFMPGTGRLSSEQDIQGIPLAIGEKFDMICLDIVYAAVKGRP